MIAGGWFAGALTFQVKLVLSLSVPSFTVTITLYVLALPAAKVPEMVPLLASIDKPVGNPVALKVNVSPSASLAVMVSEIVSPSVLFCSPGLVTLGGVFEGGGEPFDKVTTLLSRTSR